MPMRHVTLVVISPSHDRPRRIRLPVAVWRLALVVPLVLVLALAWLLVERFSLVGERSSLRRRTEQLARENARLDVVEKEVARLSRVAYLLQNITGGTADDAMLAKYRAEANRLLGAPLTDSAAVALLDSSESVQSLPSRWPVQGQVTAEFGGDHTGIDIAAPRGTPVRATAAGTVEEAGTDSILGFVVVLAHRDGYATTYGHNSHLVVVPGQNVRAGDVIGFVGSSGQATGPHLHYEVVRNGEALDPRGFLPDTPAAGSGSAMR
jgi:murein DD-endopeptidase MepM/ murein hydrolase activator NlpD